MDDPAAPFTIRELSKAIKYTYEHVRKVLAGEPVASKRMNDRLCKVLKLDAAEMWNLAQKEKLRRRFGASGDVLAPDDPRLRELWPRLTFADRKRLVEIAEAYAMATKAKE